MRTVRYLVDARAEELGDKTFLIAPESGRHMSYRWVRESSEHLGRYLMQLGLNKGDKVSFMLPNGYQTTRIFLATMYAGLVAAPINLMFHSTQLQYVLAHSETRVIFFGKDYKDRLYAALENILQNVELIEIDVDAEEIIPEDLDLSASSLPEVGEDDDALLLYTSGTTGLPKGVILSHRNIHTGGEITAGAHELTPHDRALCCLPLYHINGEVVTVIAPLVSRSSVVIPHKFSSADFWQLISRYRCTWFSVVPTIISYLCTSTETKNKNLALGQLRFGRSASSALPVSLHKAFEQKFQVPIVETMGLTETAATVFSNPMDPEKRKYGSPGRPVGCEARILDREGREVPLMNEGEILIRGDNVMKKYFKDPKRTAETLDSEGWLHTGDLGYMDEEGFVFVTGRLKELIIKGGENIAPREIDEVIYAHPAVLDAASFGIPDQQYGEEIGCCIVVKPGCELYEQDLRNYCSECLGKYKTPKFIKILYELPKGPSGKIQRLKLREDYIKSIKKSVNSE